jgi:hypothetical protein
MSQPKVPEKDGRPAPAGQVKHDSSGRAIWEWAVDSGRIALDSTSGLLKRLELPGLKLEEDARKSPEEDQAAPPERIPDKGVPTFGGKPESDPLGGVPRSFNPYDTKTSRRPAKKAAAIKPAPRITQPKAPVKKPGLFARLFGRNR